MRTAKEAEALFGARARLMIDEFVFMQRSIAWHEALWGVPYGPVDPRRRKDLVVLKALIEQSDL